MKTEGYQSNGVTTPKAQSKFSSRKEEVDKALCTIEAAVGYLERRFAPVVSPDNPNACEVEEEKSSLPYSLSDFDDFISVTNDRIYQSAARINGLCERASV